MLRLKLALAQLYLYQEHIYQACDVLRSLGDLSYSPGVVRLSVVVFSVFVACGLFSQILGTLCTKCSKICTVQNWELSIRF